MNSANNKEIKTENKDHNHIATDYGNGQNPISINGMEISTLNPRFSQEGDVSSLAQSIEKTQGILQPILIRKTSTGYEVIAGSRRFIALSKNRGEGGYLEPGEYRIVDWDDEQCVLAAVSENREREDLAPVLEGQLLNGLVDRRKAEDKKTTDKELEDMTGIPRAQINDLRALAKNIKNLPENWQAGLSSPPNCRPGDTVISLTHFKHIRKYVNENIDSGVADLMDKTFKENWSAPKLKKELNALNGNSKREEENPTEGQAASGATETKIGDKKRSPDGAPDYPEILRHLNSALEVTGTDQELADSINEVMQQVNARITSSKPTKNKAKARKKTAVAKPKKAGKMAVVKEIKA